MCVCVCPSVYPKKLKNSRSQKLRENLPLSRNKCQKGVTGGIENKIFCPDFSQFCCMRLISLLIPTPSPLPNPMDFISQISLNLTDRFPFLLLPPQSKLSPSLVKITPVYLIGLWIIRWPCSNSSFTLQSTRYFQKSQFSMVSHCFISLNVSHCLED